MKRRPLQAVRWLITASLFIAALAASYYVGYVSATKNALRANALSDLQTYVMLAREIDKRQVELGPDGARLLANRLTGAEMACSAVMGLGLIDKPRQRTEVQEIMQEARSLQAKLRPLPVQAR